MLVLACPAHAQSLLPYSVIDNSIPTPLDNLAGDPAPGKALLLNRQKSLCILCHAFTLADPHGHGTIAPGLSGAGTRWRAGQLRLRMVEPTSFNPSTMMPSAFRMDGLSNVGARYVGQTLLSAQEIEDIVVFLAQSGQ